MARDRMQKQRFEMKYLINEEVALRVRDFVQAYIDFDEYSVGKPNYSYPVHSLYLDSDTLHTYWATINGDKNRYKLRVRYYSDTPGAPVFFEIKRRVNNCIMKQRCSVRNELVRSLLDGQLPDVEMFLSKNPSHFFALQNFLRMTAHIQAKPKVHIGYLREAYVSDDDTVRVTIDRAVDAEPMLEPWIRLRMENPVRSFQGHVILELKFTNRFPNWFRELVEIFNVMQCGAAKYVESIQGIGFRRLNALHPVVGDSVGLSRVW